MSDESITKSKKTAWDWIKETMWGWIAFVVSLVVVGGAAYDWVWTWPLSKAMFWAAAVISGVVILAMLILANRKLMPSWMLLFAGFPMAGITWLIGGKYSKTVGEGTKQPPTTIENPTDPANFAALLAYARDSVEYDSTGHGDSTSHVFDQQFLAFHDPTDPDGERPGPRARIFPEKNSYLNKLSDLRGAGPGKGRVVAKIWLEDAYPPGNNPWLPRGVSYVFIDSMVVNGDTGIARAFVIPEGGRSVFGRPLRVVYRADKRRWERQSRARWLWHGHHCANTGGCEHGCCTMCGEPF